LRRSLQFYDTDHLVNHSTELQIVAIKKVLEARFDDTCSLSSCFRDSVASRERCEFAQHSSKWNGAECRSASCQSSSNLVVLESTCQLYPNHRKDLGCYK